MTNQHHPADAWLIDFALGNLDTAFETVLNAHIGVCAECRATIADAEAIGGELLGNQPGSSTTSVTLSASDICASHAQQMTTSGSVSRATETVAPDAFDHFVSTYLNTSIGALRWRSMGKGLQICRLDESDDNRLWMLKAQSGTVLPAHTHSGAELTMVLKGSYFCGSEIYRAGDIEDADEETHHQPVVTVDGECICLAVTEGKLQFKSWLPRLFQPLVGI